MNKAQVYREKIAQTLPRVSDVSTLDLVYKLLSKYEESDTNKD